MPCIARALARLRRVKAVAESNDVKIDVFDTIMRVARIEAAHGSEGFEPVDLEQLVNDLAEIFGPVIEDGNKRLRLDVANASTVCPRSNTSGAVDSTFDRAR